MRKLAKNKSTSTIHLRFAAIMASALKAWSAKQENGLKDFVKVVPYLRYGSGPEKCTTSSRVSLFFAHRPSHRPNVKSPES